MSNNCVFYTVCPWCYKTELTRSDTDPSHILITLDIHPSCFIRHSTTGNIELHTYSADVDAMYQVVGNDKWKEFIPNYENMFIEFRSIFRAPPVYIDLYSDKEYINSIAQNTSLPSYVEI